jgi:hypothetical protein
MNTSTSMTQEPLIIEVIVGHEHIFSRTCDDREPLYFFPIRDGEVHSIGRGNGCDIRLSGVGSDPAEGCVVARRHVDLKRENDVVSILDYGTSRGGRFGSRVFLNGHCLAGAG